MPEDTGFSEEDTTLILGSRKPILFVEGAGSSLDLAIYRACYPDWTVVPRGSCQNVIHAVATMRGNVNLTRITCSGIVDADDYSAEDKNQLTTMGIATLPVSEIENLFLLPDIATAILEEEHHKGEVLQTELTSLKRAVLAKVQESGAIDATVLRYCRRRIDRTLKKIDLEKVEPLENFVKMYAVRTAELDVNAVAQEIRGRIDKAIKDEDLPALLADVDNKGLFALAASHLKKSKKGDFVSWLTRAVRDPKESKLRSSLAGVLPKITPQ